MTVWWGTAVEVRSTLSRVTREGIVGGPEAQAAWNRLQVLLLSAKEISPSDRVRDLALSQVDRYALKAADALQLAAALVWCKEKPRNRLFLTNDKRLFTAAAEAGFLADSV
jgi:uncharacterized protein